MPTRRQLCEAFATFALDEGASAEPVAVQLSKLLAANSIKIITLFKALDQSLSGSINRSEFEVGMRSLGLQVASTHVYDDLFSMWDQDGSGSLSLSELADVFNRSESASTKPLSNVDLDESDDAPPMAEQLKVALSVNSVAVISLFKSWDNDGNGMISLDEFEMGLRTCATLITLQATLLTLHATLITLAPTPHSLGLDAPSSSIDALYTSWDIDGSGDLTLKELATVLSSAAIVKPLSNVDLDESDTAPPVAEQLQLALATNALQILTLFNTWCTVAPSNYHQPPLGRTHQCCYCCCFTLADAERPHLLMRRFGTPHLQGRERRRPHVASRVRDRLADSRP